jgi:6-phosphogluconate dehydrogenase (decarboxylating)
MTNKQPQQQYAIGTIGLGVMVRNLVLNMADHGFSMAGYDKDPNQVEALRKESTKRGSLCRRPKAHFKLSGCSLWIKEYLLSVGATDAHADDPDFDFIGRGDR